MLYKIFVFCIFFEVIFGSQPGPVVDIPLGRIEGFVKQTWKGRQFYAFEGVPYAKPPEGKLRFEPPQPAEPWVGVWQAKTITKCAQWNHFSFGVSDKFVGEEDCLHVNIYTPDLNPTKPLDVVVYIHGGAFMFNYGGWQGPELILEKDVVYVNLNYRLGPLGFLSTEDETVPGNMGLKDQVMALKWVQKYIKYFGGNPNSVTIIGMSAGGASVHLHYLVPESRELFHRGFSQSGTALCPWVLMEKAADKTRFLAAQVGCHFSTFPEIVNCLKTRPAKQIVDVVRDLQPWLYNPFSPFGVVVDKWSSNPVLPDHPYNLLVKKQVADKPWIISFTEKEGLYPAGEFYSDERLKDIDTRWNELMPHILDYNYTVDPKMHDSVSQTIRKHFLGDKPVNKENFNEFVQILSERLFIIDIEKTARLQSAAVKSPIYSYNITYRGAHSKSELWLGDKTNLGVSHADDTSYIFRTAMDTLSTENDRKMVEFFVDFTAEFAATGKPKISMEWPTISKDPSKPYSYVLISNDGLKIETKDELYDHKFWKSLPIIENEKLVTVAKDEL